MTTTTQFRYIGRPAKRVDGLDKVTGGARYTADVSFPWMLWAKILRSPHPHARIRSIDAAGARRMEGVQAVFTAGDVPGVLVGRNVKDLPLLARDRVRFFGERVAMVVADTADIAEEALGLIDVDYESLPAVDNPLEAKRAGAPEPASGLRVLRGPTGPVEGPPAQRRVAQRVREEDMGQGQHRGGLRAGGCHSGDIPTTRRLSTRATWSRTPPLRRLLRTGASMCGRTTSSPIT